MSAARPLTCLLPLLGLLIACGDDGADPPPPADQNNTSENNSTQNSSNNGINNAENNALPTPASLRLTLRRVEGGTAIDITAEALDAQGDPLPEVPLTLTADRGDLSPPSPLPSGGLAARLTPSSTGRYPIHLRAPGGLAADEEALVFDLVDDAWDQPVSVRGLVNTPAWEDGAAVSPDGQWLLIQYLPVPIDCILSLDKTHPTCTHALGPVGPPQRPRLPGDDRVAPDGAITHGCPSIGIPDLPFPVPPNTLYGFRRQPDGSFAEPFVITYDGIDGCVSPFGPSLRDLQGPQATLSFAFDSPTDNDADDSGGDLFTADVTLGQDITLGRFAVEGGIVLQDRIDAPLGDPSPDNRGNPHVFVHPEDNTLWVFFDDETGREDLFLARAPSPDALAEAIPLPAPVSDPQEQESQPWFDGQRLIFRRGIQLLQTELDGDPALSASWTEPRTLLRGGGSGVGALLGAGEPTVARVNGAEELYFIFIEQADGHLNLDVGVVRARQPAE